jgi:hypothetical protein
MVETHYGYFMLKKIVSLSASALVLAGCTTNTLVVVVPQQQTQKILATKAMRPCLLSSEERKKYSGADVMLSAKYVIPEKAKNDRIDGCAGIEFQLDKGGQPVHLHVVKESPQNYDIARSTLQSIKLSRFKPSSGLSRWYYISRSIVTSTVTTPKPNKSQDRSNTPPLKPLVRQKPEV